MGQSFTLNHQLLSQNLATLRTSHNTALVVNLVCQNHSFPAIQKQPGPTVCGSELNCGTTEMREAGLLFSTRPELELLLSQAIPGVEWVGGDVTVWDNKHF